MDLIRWRREAACGTDLAGDRIIAVITRNGRRYERAGSIPADSGLVASALPAYACVVRRVAVRMPSLRKALAVMPSVLDVDLPFPIEACTTIFLNLRQNANGEAEALAAVARKEDLAKWLGKCKVAGIDPVIVEPEAVGLWRAGEKTFPLGRGQRRLIVYLGEDRISLVFGDSEGIVSATGLRQGAEALARSEPTAQRLAVWWSAVCGSEPGHGVHVFWCGPACSNESARQSIRAALFPQGAPRELAPDAPEAVLPKSLAEEAWNGRAWDANLRTGELAHPALNRRAEASLRNAALALAASALVFAGIGYAGRWAVARERDAWQARLVEEARRLAGTDRLPRGQEALVALRAFERDAAGRDALAGYREPGADVLMFRALSAMRALDLHLHEITSSGRSILVRGSLSDWNDGERLVSSLFKAGIRANIERQDAGADERVHFTLRGELISQS